MSNTNITGRVYDSNDGDKGVPGARVMITDKDGNLTNGGHQLIATSAGKFDIEIPTLEIRGKYITASNSVSKRTIPLIYPSDQNYEIDIDSMKEQDVTTMYVTAEPEAVKCIQEQNGVWDSDTKVCSNKGAKRFFEQHKTPILIAGGLIVAGIIVAIIVSASKK